ncbi:hypothetical protein J3A83DRAFT_4099005, partial [Scleroderma citrinum]
NHRKLKADQWHTACLVNLVITFCRIWGHTDASEKDQALLQNYISLVITVHWATTWSTSLHHIEIIEHYMAYYIHSTLELFGPHALVFNNHVSFHIPECLCAFEPAHGWWTFPFEQFNGILQQYNTNLRPNEMEYTMLKAFCCSENLKSLLKLGQTSSLMNELQDVFWKYFGSTFSDAEQSNINALDHASSDVPHITKTLNKLVELLSNTYHGLLNCLNEGPTPSHYQSNRGTSPSMQVVQSCVQDIQMVKLNGATFTCTSKHIGNSHILFSLPGHHSLCAGEIQCIFIHERCGLSLADQDSIPEFFFVIQQYQELNNKQSSKDPYCKFPLLSVQLFSQQFLTGEHVIWAQNIHNHFASYPYRSRELKGEFLVALSLNHVSGFYILL